jgi:hypothetical protein
MAWVRYNPTGLDLRQGHAASARPLFLRHRDKRSKAG